MNVVTCYRWFSPLLVLAHVLTAGCAPALNRTETRIPTAQDSAMALARVAAASGPMAEVADIREVMRQDAALEMLVVADPLPDITQLINDHNPFIARMNSRLDPSLSVEAFLKNVEEVRDSVDSRRGLLRRQANASEAAANRMIAMSPGSSDAQKLRTLASEGRTHGVQLAQYLAWVVPLELREGVIPVPVGSTVQAECFWGTRSSTLVPGVAFASNGEQSTMGVELYSDYFRGVRYFLASGVTGSGEPDSARANIQRFSTSGGNLVGGAGFPLYIHSTGGYECGPNSEQLTPNQARLEVLFLPRIGGDVPALGTTVRGSPINVDIGTEFRLDALTSKEVFRASAEVRTGFVAGSPDFADAIGMRRHFAMFGYAQSTLAVTVGNVLRISWSYPLAAPPSIRDDLKQIVSVSVMQRGAPAPAK